MGNLGYYIGLLGVFIVGIILFKKVTGCLFRMVVILVLLGILCWGLTVLKLLG